MTPYRIKRLEELDFVWNAQEDAWRRQMKLLGKFHAENGHCNVQVNNPDYPKLGLWIKEQRRHYILMKQGKPSLLTLDRFRQLSDLDFCYDTHESIWQQRFAELVEFKRFHGHCGVSSSNATPKLSVWVHHQRRQYRKMKLGLQCHMSQERSQALDSVGFTWSPRKGRHTITQGTDDRDATDTDDGSIDPTSDDECSSDAGASPPVKKRLKR
jgi:Helicase associated domain